MSQHVVCIVTSGLYTVTYLALIRQKLKTRSRPNVIEVFQRFLPKRVLLNKYLKTEVVHSIKYSVVPITTTSRLVQR